MRIPYHYIYFSVYAPVSMIGDCGSILEAGHQTSGIYQIQPFGFDDAFDVFCDMDIDEGGWTVRQIFIQ